MDLCSANDIMCIMRNVRWVWAQLRLWLAHRLHRPKPDNVEVFAWI